ATWAGGYIGVNGGAGIANAEFLDPDNDDSANTKFQTPFGTVGGQIGYNWQSRAMVIGFEGGINLASVSASKAVGLDDGIDNGTARFKLDAFATFRARMGLAYENALVYVTAGPAIGHFKSSATFGDRADPPLVQELSIDNKWHWGFAAGAGVEYMFSNNWTLKGEYLFLG